MTQAERQKAEGLEPMCNAPRDGTDILLKDSVHGWTQAHYSKGEWSWQRPDSVREYSGSVWICGDDAWQIEVEELPEDAPQPYDDGTAMGWLPLDTLNARTPSAAPDLASATRQAELALCNFTDKSYATQGNISEAEAAIRGLRAALAKLEPGHGEGDRK